MDYENEIVSKFIDSFNFDDTFFLSLFDPMVSSAIKDWDVSLITDMTSLFYEKSTCNPEIGSWDVSGVTNFVSIATNI